MLRNLLSPPARLQIPITFMQNVFVNMNERGLHDPSSAYDCVLSKEHLPYLTLLKIFSFLFETRFPLL